MCSSAAPSAFSSRAPQRTSAMATCTTWPMTGLRSASMITGDHPLTALSIARDLGITTSDHVITWVNQPSMMPVEILTEKVKRHIRLCPRVSRAQAQAGAGAAEPRSILWR